MPRKGEHSTNREISFTKRRNEILTKAYELSVICDTDVALIIFSPTGKATIFAGKQKRVEDVFLSYLNLPIHDGEDGIPRDKLDFLRSTLESLRDQGIQHQRFYDMMYSPDAQVKELANRVHEMRLRLEKAKTTLSIFEDDFDQIEPLHDLGYRECMLQESLIRVKDRRRELIEQYYKSRAQSIRQTMYGSGFTTAEIPNHVPRWTLTIPQDQIANVPSRDQTPAVATAFWASSGSSSASYSLFANQGNQLTGPASDDKVHHQETGHVNLHEKGENHAAGNMNFKPVMPDDLGVLLTLKYNP